MIFGDRWIERPRYIADTVRAYRPDEIVIYGITAGQMAIKMAGRYEGPTLYDALLFAGHDELGVALREAQQRSERASTAYMEALAMWEESLPPRTGDLFDPSGHIPAPEWLDALYHRTRDAEAARAAVYDRCRPVVEDAELAG